MVFFLWNEASLCRLVISRAKVSFIFNSTTSRWHHSINSNYHEWFEKPQFYRNGQPYLFLAVSAKGTEAPPFIPDRKLLNVCKIVLLSCWTHTEESKANPVVNGHCQSRNNCGFLDVLTCQQGGLKLDAGSFWKLKHTYSLSGQKIWRKIHSSHQELSLHDYSRSWK